MSLSIQYGRKTEAKLKEVLEEMLAEAFSNGADEDATGNVANLVGEVLQLVAMCRQYSALGKHKQYEIHVYASSKGVQWQYFQVGQ